jgi:hypothetical protein
MQQKSKWKLHYDLPSVDYCLGVKHPSGAQGGFYYSRQLLFVDVGSLQFLLTLASSHSWVHILWDWWPYFFTVSDMGLTQPGRPGPCIYTPQEQCCPVIPLGTEFSFWTQLTDPAYNILARRTQKTLFLCCCSWSTA